MSTFRKRILVSTALLALGTGLSFSDDSKSVPSETPKPASVDKSKGPEFAGYQWMYMLTAEVMKADDSKVTVRVYWPHVVNKGTGNGNRGGRRSLNGGGAHHSPFMIRRPNVQVKWEHTDYDIPYVAESLVRTKTLPPKTGPDGKRGFYSEKEQDELKVPYSVPGFQASKSDLVLGTIIEAHLIRDKTIPANKVTDADIRIKYAVILRHDPNPPKDVAPSPSPAKKN